MLIVPRKRIWTQQPQGAAQIDPCLGFNHVWLPSAGMRDLAGNSHAISPVLQVSDKGVSLLCAGTASAIPLTDMGPTFTIFILARKNASGDFSVGLSGDNYTAGGYSVLFYGGVVYTSRDGGSNTSFPGAPSPEIGAWKLYVLRSNNSVAPSLFINGIKYTGGGVVSGSLLASYVNTPGYTGQSSTAILASTSRYLTDLEIKSISANLWQIFRAPDSHIFVPTGAGAGGGDSLTASSIIAAHATVGSPLLSQQHALTASSIASAPAVVASPAITQRHALSSTAASASPAVVGSPSITQRHALTATAISAGPAIVGLPTLTEIVAGVLSALPIVSAPAVVGAPAITQKHALSTGAISAGPATFGTPTLEQQHALMAQGITASSATVGATALSEGGAAPFTAEQFLYLEANYVTIANINDIAAAVLAALQASPVPFPANVKKVNDLTVVGRGMAPPNHWRPE